ncbi:hypothetical protein GCM10023208_21410 [Erythrobacter westpacificensis]|uniref:Uncharacterized protein n=1 Tax=Erythrobacter westpacificensis TaxID=1055231 RepID=A0ABP9KGD4_9SPHN
MSRRFDLATETTENDSVVTATGLPALTGDGTEDLCCGGCGEVLAEKLTVPAIQRMLPTERKLILRCICSANNVVSDVAEGTSNLGSNE